MLERAGSSTLVVDGEGLGRLDEILELVEHPLRVVVPMQDSDPGELAGRWPQHTFVGPSDMAPASAWSAPSVAPDELAYLLFTSGSTGQPKGVMVTHRNILRFLDVVAARYDLAEIDRFSHVFDVTFDLSLFDLFAAWKVGGCLCCPNAKDRLLPSKYVVESSLTVWFSVPATALLMNRTRTLVDGGFSDLRWSLFCGEALPVEIAEAWARAAPASVVDNLYGPTELTLACTAYRWGPDGPADSEHGVVPIGAPFPGMSVMVVDHELREVAPGQAGELIVTGPQLTPGYWRDPQRTAAAYVVPPGESRVFYRTGDRVRRPPGDGPLVYLGRVDHQVKIRGYRVELGEIEAVMRREAGVAAAVAVGWPSAPSGAEGVVGFVDDETVDPRVLREKMAEHLPGYMVPRAVHVVDRFPLNQNGKIDRRALLATLE
jgi:amino acid adenylation domain-containing protein